MDIDYIHEFVVLAETGNYLEAADKLFMTQSSLTRHIQKMEADFGVTLFDRTTRKISLNSYGRMFLPFARQIAELQTDYQKAFADALLLEKSSIRIGTIPVMAQYQITSLIAGFQKENSNVMLDVNDCDTLQAYKQLYDHKLDFAITREFSEENSDFERIPITFDTVVALLPKDHPFAGQPSIELKMLYRNPLILLGKDTFMYSLCVSECQKAGFEPHVAFTSHQVYNIIDLIAKGMGVGLVTKRPVMALNLNDIVVADISPTIRTNINLTYLKSLKMSPAQKAFADFFRKHALSISESEIIPS